MLVSIPVILIVTENVTLVTPLLLALIILSKQLRPCVIWSSDEQERWFFRSNGNAITEIVKAYLLYKNYHLNPHASSFVHDSHNE